jgi:hypothetical protein
VARYWGSLEEYVAKVGPRARDVHRAGDATARRLPRRRPRDPREEELLTHLDLLRWQKALASGLLQKLGPRRYRLNG